MDRERGSGIAPFRPAWDRPKDWIDIEQMLFGEATMDKSELEAWLKAVIGDGDSRYFRVHDLWKQAR